ncbi:hypothetical protein [Streptomyces clavifer]
MHGNERAGEALSWLDAVWPCELSCFVVVDLDDYARAHGITHPDERTGLKEHIHEVRGGRIGPRAEPSEYTRRRRGLRCLRLREP